MLDGTINLDRLIFLLKQARDQFGARMNEEAIAHPYPSGNISIRTEEGELLAYVDIHNEKAKRHDPAIAGRVRGTPGKASGQVKQSYG